MNAIEKVIAEDIKLNRPYSKGNAKWKKKEKNKLCTWRTDGSGEWSPSCNEYAVYYIDTKYTNNTPYLQNWKYCMNCGKLIVIAD